MSLLGASFILGLLGLLLQWWQIEVSNRGRTYEFFAAQPYSAGFEGEIGAELLDGSEDDVLATEATLTGIFLTVGLVAIAAAGVLLVVSMLRMPLPNWLLPTLAGVAALTGLLITVMAAAVWPSAWEDDTESLLNEHDPGDGSNFAADVDPSWWGSDEAEGVTIDYSPSAGWFLAIIGYVLTPLAAVAVQGVPWGLLAGEAPPPRAQNLPSPAAPPPLPTRPVAQGPANPPPAPPKPVATSGTRRRIAVVSKQKPSKGTKR